MFTEVGQSSLGLKWQWPSLGEHIILTKLWFCCQCVRSSSGVSALSDVRLLVISLELQWKRSGYGYCASSFWGVADGMTWSFIMRRCWSALVYVCLSSWTPVTSNQLFSTNWSKLGECFSLAHWGGNQVIRKWKMRMTLHSSLLASSNWGVPALLLAARSQQNFYEIGSMNC